MTKDKSESMRRWESSPGYVYFIGAQEPPIAIKIGISTQKDIKRRFSTIQGGNHEPLYLRGVIAFETGEKPMADAQKAEKELHKKFGHLQHAINGWAGSEWFEAKAELIDFIRANSMEPEKVGLERTIYKPKRESGR